MTIPRLNRSAAYIDLQSDPDRVRVVASFAQTVTALAPTDVAALQISLRAARELSLSVLAGLSQVLDAEAESAAACGGRSGYSTAGLATYSARVVAATPPCGRTLG